MKLFMSKSPTAQRIWPDTQYNPLGKQQCHLPGGEKVDEVQVTGRNTKTYFEVVSLRYLRGDQVGIYIYMQAYNF